MREKGWNLQWLSWPGKQRYWDSSGMVSVWWLVDGRSSLHSHPRAGIGSSCADVCDRMSAGSVLLVGLPRSLCAGDEDTPGSSYLSKLALRWTKTLESVGGAKDVRGWCLLWSPPESVSWWVHPLWLIGGNCSVEWPCRYDFMQWETRMESCMNRSSPMEHSNGFLLPCSLMLDAAAGLFHGYS